MHCSSCGVELSANDELCPDCRRVWLERWWICVRTGVKVGVVLGLLLGMWVYARRVSELTPDDDFGSADAAMGALFFVMGGAVLVGLAAGCYASWLAPQQQSAPEAEPPAEVEPPAETER